MNAAVILGLIFALTAGLWTVGWLLQRWDRRRWRRAEAEVRRLLGDREKPSSPDSSD